ARRAGLDFVPVPISTRAADRTGRTWVSHAGRLWDLTTWQPGKADFREDPTQAKLVASCRALASLHEAWSERPARQQACPAVERRKRTLEIWLDLLAGGWKPDFVGPPDDSVAPIADNAWQRLPEQVDWVKRLLHSVDGRVVPVQPCLCDIWHDHVLF